VACISSSEGWKKMDRLFSTPSEPVSQRGTMTEN